MATRTWARGTATTYSYNNAGEQSAIDYADSTADVSFNYNRLGRMTNVVNGAMTTTIYFNSLNQFLGESYSGGVLNGLRVTNSYDALLRRATNGALNGSTWLTQTRYNYDAASRLKTVGASTNTVAYSYLANSPLVENVWFTNGSILRMTTTKQYDYLNRLKQISSTPSAASAITFNYAYNAANQRTAITNADSSRWTYQYDLLGQVTSGKKFWSDGTPVAGQQFEYGFDDIGNRNTTASGGDQYGANLRYASYTNNTLNQITGRSVPGYVNVLGSATNSATVTVNNQPTYRKGDYFRAELATNNATAPLWLGITNLAVLNDGSNPDIVSSVTGNVYVAKSPEIYTYDLDGNLTSDGRWTNRWDAENRLIEMETLTSVPTAAKLRLNFAYDYQGRRIQKVVSTWNGSAYVAQSTNRFIYDGWNLIAELNHTNGIIRTYAWGLDLSGSEQGAGGVGGLLMLSQATTTSAQLFCAYDGNGNLMALIGATSGVVAANYEYDPFGEVLRSSGAGATANPFRFSTKYEDGETGLFYYGYRYYDPSAGRWNSRDPLGESGFENLYCAFENTAVSKFDPDGRKAWTREAALELLWKTVRSWEAKVEPIDGDGYMFAARVLRHFLNKRGPYPYVGIRKDNERIFIDPQFRAALKDKGLFIHIGAFGAELKNVKISGQFEEYFQANFFNNNDDLFYALGNGHFSYCGLFSYKNGNFMFRGRIDQVDSYDFRDSSVGRLNDQYEASYFLQTYHGYQSFKNRERFNIYVEKKGGKETWELR